MKKILILFSLIIASLTSSEAHELIDAYFKTIESKELVSEFSDNTFKNKLHANNDSISSIMPIKEGSIDSAVLINRNTTNNFSGLAIDIAYNRNQFSYNLGFCFVGSRYGGSIKDGIGNSKYNFHFNFIGVDYIDKDAHNDNLSNHSYFTDYSLLWIPISFLPTMAIIGWDERSPWLNIMFAPFIIGCSKFGYIIDQRNLFSSINFLTSSIYIKSKLDFFGQRSTKFWRYKPGFGLEFSYIFKGKTTIDPKECDYEHTEGSNGIFLNCGFDYPIDFVNGGKTATKGLVPSFGLKFAFGF